MEFGNIFKRVRPPEDQRCLELHDSSGYFSAWTIMACQINPSVSYSLCYLYMYVIKVILLALIHILKVCIFNFPYTLHLLLFQVTLKTKNSLYKCYSAIMTSRVANFMIYHLLIIVNVLATML